MHHDAKKDYSVAIIWMLTFCFIIYTITWILFFSFINSVFLTCRAYWPSSRYCYEACI
jgi:hypothetical protein